jgi:hypothetical protein
MEDPEIKPGSYSHLILDKDAKNISLRKSHPLQQMVLRYLNVEDEIGTLSLTPHK